MITLDAYVLDAKPEGDGDLHVVITDFEGYTMIIEFPDPFCMKGSRVLDLRGRSGGAGRARLC